LLGIDKSTIKTYSILVLSGENSDQTDLAQEDALLRFISLASTDVGTVKLVTNCLSLKHSVVEVNDESIMEITSKCFKIDVDKIVNDIKKRQIPRFRDDPPSNSTQNALQDLKRHFEEISSHNDFTPEVMSWINDFRIQDMDLIQRLQKLQSLKIQILSLSCCTLTDFCQQFKPVYQRQKLEDELKNTEYLLSEGSLKFLPDYHQRVDVLKKLGYIDDNKRVKLKGRVACEMGSQELMITELVLDNLLTDRPASEIAALLSCMVFQQKNCSEPELTEPLRKGVEEIKKGANMIGNMQKECGMKETEYVDQFHFGLVQVVYEWARGMPFAQITQLTDVQEGVIVRTIQRLDETLRDVKDAARVIGDPILYQKMDEASTLIKRDIVFAASLYTQ
jgi:antiviral helicase SKI2